MIMNKKLLFTLFVLYSLAVTCAGRGQAGNNNGVNGGYSYPKYENMSTRYVSWIVREIETESEPIESNQPKPYCSFFNNRQPTAQINLKNCTWYHENSCCLQSEIESTFSKVKPLIGSSELCQKHLNYLMCYICAPTQFKFYGKERLTVCTEYCDKMFEACGDAILKGSRINEIYSNGIEFCKSRRYNIDVLDNDKCFYYNIESTTISTALTLHQKQTLLFLFVSILIFAIFAIFI